MSFFEFPHTRTYDSDLGWLIKDYKTLDELVAVIKQWIVDTQPTIDELERLYNDIISGNFPDEMKESLKTWIQENAIDLIGELVKMVFFGITDDGYFVAYIPESWNDITFNTTAYDINVALMPEYGHLVLSY